MTELCKAEATCVNSQKFEMSKEWAYGLGCVAQEIYESLFKDLESNGIPYGEFPARVREVYNDDVKMEWKEDFYKRGINPEELEVFIDKVGGVEGFLNVLFTSYMVLYCNWVVDKFEEMFNDSIGGIVYYDPEMGDDIMIGGLDDEGVDFLERNGLYDEFKGCMESIGVGCDDGGRIFWTTPKNAIEKGYVEVIGYVG